ncbi:MAG: hypothetical protein ACHBN1_07155 [Heteroscytonema crispum UTEX LB 1556]
MSNFSLKSLTFYGVTIASVLVLFKVVTVYGETSLKAAPAISDRYRLTLAENLPNCEKSKSLMLNIQQSGIYLNGSLVPETANTENSKTNEPKPTLTGLLKNQQLNLTGQVPKSVLCQNAASQTPTNSQDSVTTQIQLANKQSFTGQITVNGTSKALFFTAVPQIREQSKKLNSH